MTNHNQETVFYEVSIAMNRASYARFMVALLTCRCRITDTYCFSPPATAGRADTAVLMVEMPKNRVEDFRAMANPQDMRLPSAVHLNSGDVRAI